jgi:hypothetical protein
VPVPVPTGQTRWRCALCGNLTRFDVTRSQRAREYVHLDLAGQERIEEREILAETIEQVRCRWCDGVDTVELVPKPAGTAADQPGGTGPAGDGATGPGGSGGTGTAGAAGERGSEPT